MTLAGVEQASRRFPEPIAVDYLSRLERGTLMPSVPKLATLANVYQRPLHEFVDLYELEHLKAIVPELEGGFGHFRQLAIDYRLQGDHRRSTGAMLRGLDAARADGDIDATAQALTSVGIGLNTLGRYNAAQRFLEDALRTVRDDRIRGFAFHNLALSHHHLDNWALAQCLCDKASTYGHEDRRLDTHIRDLQASLLNSQGRYEEASVIYRDVARAYEELGETQNATLTRYNLGNTLVNAKKVEEGLTLLRESMARAAELGDPRLRAMSALFYGRALYQIGRYEDAISPLKAAFLIARDRDMAQQAFDSAFYLWRLSDDKGLPIEGDWLEEARRYRPNVDQLAEEGKEFDAWAARERKKPRPGRRPKDLM